MEVLTDVCCSIIGFIFVYGAILICGFLFMTSFIYLIKGFVEDVRTWRKETKKEDDFHGSWFD